MKIVAAVFADLDETFLGRPSRLTERLGTRAILGHTLTRLSRVDGLERRILFVRPLQAPTAAALVAEVGFTERVELLATDVGRRPRRALFRAARKWNLDSWRGGPLTSTWFDEYVEPSAVAAVLDHTGADAALCLDGHQAALDVPITRALLAQQQVNAADARFTFSQAPPGVAGIVLTRAAIHELLERRTPVGVALGYRPEIPQGDPITRAGCLHIDARIAQTQARLVADTRRSCELLGTAFETLGEDCEATALCEWLREPGSDRAGPLPVEVELELTTDDPLPQTRMRPRGERVPRRHLRDFAALERIAAELGTYDDRLIFLGGFGDPLRHPDFARVLRVLRDARVAGIGVATPLVELPASALEALFEYSVDVLQVRLDAATAVTYKSVHAIDAFGAVLANVDRVEAARRDRGQAAPIVICSMTRCAATIDEQERFFDEWIRRTGSVLIEGYNDFGGLLAADHLLPTAPPIRVACRRLGARLMLLADGVVARCGQDVCGLDRLGCWDSESLTEIWSGRMLTSLRRRHHNLDLAELPGCVACSEWSRA